ncbi:hypothetical protein P8S54_05715 [Thiomicrospira sp. R3]|uniref:hypothetical protein n=1 Tax=Thiomicrospira sp. R3 TaxID=3035472 RepID=UPI00259B751C|nr:hypothetical protein [Thiomicrospira sp. R3]WFE67734.1 hypothetical protein P8S54_05715 [Thiomicrospira sp. R3]
MLQHATQFSFDRLKFVVPLVLAIGLALSLIKNKAAFTLFSVFIVIASSNSLESYNQHLEKHSSWQSVHTQNYDLFDRVQNQIAETYPQTYSCLKFASNISVRGYANLMVERGIFERKSESWLYLNKGECLGIYLQAQNVYPDLPKYLSISIIDGEGVVTKFKPQQEPVKASIDLELFFLSDSDWEKGISRNQTGFFLPSKPNNLSKFEVGAIVIFKDGSERKIIDTKLNGQYLNVFVEGYILSYEEVGLPSQFKIK